MLAAEVVAEGKRCAPERSPGRPLFWPFRPDIYPAARPVCSRLRTASAEVALQRSVYKDGCPIVIGVILLVTITVRNRCMARKLSAAHERVRVYRAKMKQQGFRQISIWVPDTKSPRFRQECRRQSRLASAADQSVRLDDLLNVAAGSVEGWT
jgi:hypothetical protein